MMLPTHAVDGATYHPGNEVLSGSAEGAHSHAGDEVKAGASDGITSDIAYEITSGASDMIVSYTDDEFRLAERPAHLRRAGVTRE